MTAFAAMLLVLLWSLIQTFTQPQTDAKLCTSGRISYRSEQYVAHRLQFRASSAETAMSASTIPSVNTGYGSGRRPESHRERGITTDEVELVLEPGAQRRKCASGRRTSKMDPPTSNRYVAFETGGTPANRVILIQNKDPPALLGQKRAGAQPTAARADDDHVEVRHATVSTRPA